MGNSVIIIEHNLEVMKTADLIIDLGPEGGEGGGWVVAAGTPEEVAGVDGSATGRALRPVLGVGREAPARRRPVKTGPVRKGPVKKGAGGGGKR